MRRLFVETPLPFEEAAQWATDDELTTARSFSTARGCEYLAWRAIVRRELGRDTAIAYNSVGAPVLINRSLYISVSHCRERIAVALSDMPCAVDIERTDRDFSRALPRYLSPEEQRSSTHPRFPAVAWCAKEVLYKYAGRRELDLLRDLHIDGIRWPSRLSTFPALLSANPSAMPSSPRLDGIPADTAWGSIHSHDAEGSPRTLHFYQYEGFVVVFLLD